MTLQMKRTHIEQFEKFSKLHDYRKALLDKDPIRFYALGPENTRAFIINACEYAHRAELPTVRDVLYLMHVMSYLGSYFYEDPRYQALHQIYMGLGEDDVAKSNRVYKKFKVFAENYIGENGKRLLQNLPRIRGLLKQEDLSLEGAFASFYHSVGIESKNHKLLFFELFSKNAEASSRQLQINSPRGQKLCLGISLFSGIGFYKDPLSPWVRDICANTKYQTVDERIDALVVFLDTRLRYHQRKLEKLNER